MNSSEAKKLYPLYTKYRTKKNKDLLLVQRYHDPISHESTTMLVVDLDSQQEMRIDFDKWEKGMDAGDLWRVQPKEFN